MRAQATDAGARRGPPWSEDAVIDELHVRALQGSSVNGMGDFVGLTRKLGFLQDGGATLWLLPFGGEERRAWPDPFRVDHVLQAIERALPYPAGCIGAPARDCRPAGRPLRSRRNED